MDEDVSSCGKFETQSLREILCSKFVTLAFCCLFQYFADPLIAMEHILDSLKLLDYENQFCKQK